jgi:membrane-bound lytic murein transglycosylase
MFHQTPTLCTTRYGNLTNDPGHKDNHELEAKETCRNRSWNHKSHQIRQYQQCQNRTNYEILGLKSNLTVFFFVQSAQLENCQIKGIYAGVALIDHHISNQMEKPIYQMRNQYTNRSYQAQKSTLQVAICQN